ncbi:D-mannonate dehydratase ManD [Populibacterium corticicola]|uniref:D-mannonate dehydratase ManD n=1 Tax=Populibacterium corticicola TaxID=1812826 RepID=A0ABW5XHF1_9MICO
MFIEKIDVFCTSPGRTFVTVRITTSDGVVGYGDSTLNGREQAVATYLRDHLVPMLIGHEDGAIESCWQLLYRGVYWRRGAITMAAIAGIDMALWDIKAKRANIPLYQLLGGRSRTGCLAYGHAFGKDIPNLVEHAHGLLEQGFKAVRLQAGIPGHDSNYGVPLPNQVDQGNLPVTEYWDTPSYLRFIPEVFSAARSELGEEVHLLHDSHHRLRPIEAARLAQDLEPYRLFWLEDCVPAENQEVYRLIRSKTVTPLAVGEVFNTVWDAQTLVTEQLIDYLRMSITHGGGITAMRKIFDFASIYQVRSGIHGPEDVSPIGMAAAIHLDTALHNFGIQEYSGYQSLSMDVFTPDFTFESGMLFPGEAPGLGVSYDEELANAYPYERSYLPINRLRDGSVHDW